MLLAHGVLLPQDGGAKWVSRVTSASSTERGGTVALYAVDVIIAADVWYSATRRTVDSNQAGLLTLWGSKRRPTPLDLVICVFSSQSMIVRCGVASALPDLPPPSESVDVAG